MRVLWAGMLALIVVAGAGLVGGPFIAGVLVESQWDDEQINAMVALQNYHIKAETAAYRRGLFSSSVEMRWDIDLKEDGALHWLSEHRISHGLRLTQADLARMTTSIFPRTEKGQDPGNVLASVKSTVFLTGDSRHEWIWEPTLDRVRSSGMNLVIREPEAYMELNRKGEMTNMQLGLPELTFRNGDETFVLEGFSLQGAQPHVDGQTLAAGQWTLDLGRLQLKFLESGAPAEFLIGSLHARSENDVQDSALSGHWDMFLEQVSLNGFKLDQLRLVANYSGLDVDVLQEWSADISKMASTNDAQTMESLLTPERLRALLDLNPALEITDLFAQTPDGNLGAQGRFSMDGSSVPSDMPVQEFALLLSRAARGTGSITISRSLLEKALQGVLMEQLRAQSAMMNYAAPKPKNVESQVQMLVGMALTMGVLRSDDAGVHVSAEYERGEVKINDQPIGNLLSLF